MKARKVLARQLIAEVIVQLSSSPLFQKAQGRLFGAAEQKRGLVQGCRSELFVLRETHDRQSEAPLWRAVHLEDGGHANNMLIGAEQSIFALGVQVLATGYWSS